MAQLCNGKVLFTGKIIDVDRRTVQGFARGKLIISAFAPIQHRPNALGGPRGVLEIDFQNENLIARSGSEVLCTVPDLITLVTLEDGEPIGTESLRYGLRVAVLAMPAPKELKTPEALAVVGPRAFGYDVDFVPMPGDLL